MLDNVELVQTLEDTKSKAVEVIISFDFFREILISPSYSHS